jgi:hypothetical protein
MRSTAILVAVAGLARLAYADDASDAEQLFNDGQQLKEAGKPEEACAKFRASLVKNRNAVGTILNVALCDENEGKIASAYKLFSEAENRAREQNLAEHQKAAAEHRRKLELSVPHVAITFAEPAHDTKLVVDDKIVDVGSAGDVELDPGTRTIVVTAPGRVAYTTMITVQPGDHKTVEIPRLARPVNNGRKNIGKVLVYSGAGVVVAGIVVGIYAHHKYTSQFSGNPPHCDDSPPNQDQPMCDPTGYAATHSAKTLGWVGTGVGAAGLVAAGIGAYLWFTAPHVESATHVSFAPSLTPTEAGIVAVGRF